MQQGQREEQQAVDLHVRRKCGSCTQPAVLTCSHSMTAKANVVVIIVRPLPEKQGRYDELLDARKVNA
jgi:hypothetical protein